MAERAAAPIRVSHVIVGLGVGGAERMLEGLLTRTDRDQFSPSVVSLRSEGVLEPEIRRLGVPVVSLGMPSDARFVLWIPRLAQILRHQRPHVIQTWMYHADLLGGVAGSRPIVWGVHHLGPAPRWDKRPTRLVARLCAWLSPRVPQAIVYCSEAVRQAHERFGYRAARHVVIPNGVDTTRFHADAEAARRLRASFGLPADARLIGMASRFHPQKDHPTFLRACQRIHAQVPSARFVLCGEGTDANNQRLRGMVEELGLGAYTFLLGVRQDMARLMASLDVAVQTSLGTEGLPLAVLEAMACEVPCVVTEVGDVPRVVGAGGVSIPAQSPDRLADEIGRLLRQSPEERRSMGRAGRARVVSLFSLDSSAAAYQVLHASLAGEWGLKSRPVVG